MKEKVNVEIGKGFIELYKLLKWSKIIESGSLSKEAILNGEVILNENVELDVHSKVYPKDIVEYKNFILNIMHQ